MATKQKRHSTVNAGLPTDLKDPGPTDNFPQDVKKKSAPTPKGEKYQGNPWPKTKALTDKPFSTPDEYGESADAVPRDKPGSWTPPAAKKGGRGPKRGPLQVT